jgi:hypothetical protein
VIKPVLSILLLYHTGTWPLAQLALKVTDSPTQILPSPAVPLLGGATFGFIVTEALAETGLVQLICVQVTVKVPAAVTVIELVVALFDHK